MKELKTNFKNCLQSYCKQITFSFDKTNDCSKIRESSKYFQRLLIVIIGKPAKMIPKKLQIQFKLSLWFLLTLYSGWLNEQFMLEINQKYSDDFWFQNLWNSWRKMEKLEFAPTSCSSCIEYWRLRFFHVMQFLMEKLFQSFPIAQFSLNFGFGFCYHTQLIMDICLQFLSVFNDFSSQLAIY